MVVAIALPIVAATSVLEAGHRLEGAADAAVIAAADAAGGWIEANPCELAAEVLAAAESRLEECAVDSDTGRVRLSASSQTMLGTARARVHAGPPFP